MARLLGCNRCGHAQLIGHNPVDGRVKWWTRCEKCGKGNAFIATPKIPELPARPSEEGDE